MEIEIENLSKAYSPEKYVLSGINLKLRPPSRVGLIGLNGAGKTTFIEVRDNISRINTSNENNSDE